jgi:hypothetical protein
MLPDMRGKGRGNADLPCGGAGTYEEAHGGELFRRVWSGVPKIIANAKRKPGEGRGRTVAYAPLIAIGKRLVTYCNDRDTPALVGIQGEEN